LKNNTRKKIICLSTVLLFAPLTASADIVGDTRPDFSERDTLPDFESESPTNILPALPELPPLPERDPSLSSLEKILVNKFELRGNTVFSNAELAEITKSYEGRWISPEELQEVKNKITLHYINNGYVNSGAIIPDQQVVGGVIELLIIEGQLFQVEISGNDRIRTPYLQKRLEGDEEETLNINDLQERLLLIQQNPLIARVNAELGPGIKLGESILRVDVEEKRPYDFNFRFNNHRSPSIGAYRGELEGQHRNVSGWGDSFYARYGLTEGLNDYTLNYSVPLNHRDTTLSFHIENSDSEVVSEPFKQLNVESKAYTYAVTLTHPFYRTPNQSFKAGLRLEKRTSKTFLLNRAYEFSPGAENGKSEISVIRFSQDWLDRSRTQVIAARSVFSLGINALGSTIHNDGTPDSRFFTWLGQFQWVKRLETLDSQILFRTDFQWANQDLLPLEKFSIGGASTVRGYRENELTRDNGAVSALEWRIPVAQWKISKLSLEQDDGTVELIPFIDYGRSWSAKSATTGQRELFSTGLGVRWTPSQKIQAELFWGKALRDVPEPEDDDLQDDGIHFEVNIAF